jgi:phosphohistidine phosphatase
MLLYLVRHGKAEAGADDAARRLTDGGRRAVRHVAKRLESAGVGVDRIEHSGLARARETAEILTDAVGGQVIQVPYLNPEEDVTRVAGRLVDTGASNLMLVGHLPFMERLASYLLIGDDDANILHFRTSAIACFSSNATHWTLEWFLPPDL